jgi:predicted CoA-binding protein
MPEDAINQFLNGDVFAVAGASQNRNKYGNKVLRAYMQANRKVFPIHPAADVVEGLDVYRDLASLPTAVHGLSIVTPPAVTESLIEQAADLDIQHIWLQPGAENPRAVQMADDAGINLIHSGPCLLVVLGYRETDLP